MLKCSRTCFCLFKFRRHRRISCCNFYWQPLTHGSVFSQPSRLTPALAADAATTRLSSVSPGKGCREPQGAAQGPWSWTSHLPSGSWTGISSRWAQNLLPACCPFLFNRPASKSPSRNGPWNRSMKSWAFSVFHENPRNFSFTICLTYLTLTTALSHYFIATQLRQKMNVSTNK